MAFKIFLLSLYPNLFSSTRPDVKNHYLSGPANIWAEILEHNRISHNKVDTILVDNLILFKAAELWSDFDASIGYNYIIHLKWCKYAK